MLARWKKSYDKPKQCIKKPRHHFANQVLYSQSYSSSHVRMWELDHKESLAPKNWCFPTVMLEKTLENPLESKMIKLVNPKWTQSWIFIGMTDFDPEAPIFGHLMWRDDSLEKTLMVGTIACRRRRGDRGWDGWTASLTQRTWIWANARRQCRTGKPGVLQSMESQGVRHDWATEQTLSW